MLNSSHTHSSSSWRSPLSQWVATTLRAKGQRLRFRVKGNHLHILCEGNPCPDQVTTLRKLIPALQRTNLNTLLPSNHSSLYQVWAYGRTSGHPQPQWAFQIHLDQLDRHWQQVKQLHNQKGHRVQVAAQGGESAAPPESARPGSRSKATGGALVIAPQQLAKRGDPQAIAYYLSETISTLGVAVQVSVKTVPYQPKPNATLNTTVFNSATQRLWISCEAAYSPDPFVIGEPIARQLRELELEDFRDAVIVIQVAGESHPDWTLRVDLTPPREMLREWGRWGDLEAIAHLIRQALADHSLELADSSLKESTLHLVCQVLDDKGSSFPSQSEARQAIAPLLDTLGPQGIHAAMVYGQVTGAESPAWVDWLELPAARYPDLSDAPIQLAHQGDWDAIATLLTRMLNPDLEQQLATGGVRLQLLQRQDLLHVMVDAPTCPDREQVGTAVTRFLNSLELRGITGVRVYGRRAGQKRPRWSYGMDFVVRDRLVPEAPPQFAATDAYVGELVAQRGELVHRVAETADQDEIPWKSLGQRLTQSLQTALLRSKLFISTDDRPDASTAGERPFSPKVAILCGAIGLVLVFQTDWLLHTALQAHSTTERADIRRTPIFLPATPQPIPAAQATPPAPPVPSPSVPPVPSPSVPPLPSLSFQKTPQEETEGVFSGEGFTGSSPSPAPAIATSPVETIPLPSIEYEQENRAILQPGLAPESPLPTFNSRQFDEKIALYYQHLEKTQQPPDIMIVGSSRALRGIDPTALRQELSVLGYPNATIFNFGINGATAQVVDMLVRQLLTPGQLPRLILWADGARAFNSGTVDVTYNGIAVSEGFRQLADGTLPIPENVRLGGDAAVDLATERPITRPLTDSYQNLDRWLSDRLADLSRAQDERDRLKALLQSLTARFAANPPSPVQLSPLGNGTQPDMEAVPLTEGEGMDTDGFLALSARFNPATYYQKYAKVSGQYDSDYDNFRITGSQSEAVRSLLAFTQSRQIPIVFVNLPLTNDYLDPVRRQHEEAFRQYLVSLDVSQPQFIFRDFGELWPDQHDYFSDPSHLNRYGALQVSVRLAQDPIIPWNQALETN